MSFSELRALMTRLQIDQEVYRQYENKVFVVACKMVGHHQYFNIDKKKKKKRDRKNKDDKVRLYDEVIVLYNGLTYFTTLLLFIV